MQGWKAEMFFFCRFNDEVAGNRSINPEITSREIRNQNKRKIHEE